MSIAPGAAAALFTATAALALHQLPVLGLLSPPILATALGVAVGTMLGGGERRRPGQAFVLRRLLRLAIILLGFQISVSQIVSLGAHGIVLVAVATPATYLFIALCARMLGVDARLGALIAAGTSICGASAIMAANSVVQAKDEDAAYAIAVITLLGTAGMFLYPAAAPLAGLAGADFGLWSGASLHEVAQAVGAAFQAGEAAGHAGVVAKLLRVGLLGPLVVILALRHRGAERAPTPWYLIGFAFAIAINSYAPPPAALKAALVTATTFLMTTALAAMGLSTDLRALVRRGPKPLAVGVLGTAFISLVTLALIKGL
ncbi:putative sulfate exporter family transporter [Caulobacter segnis]|uniref:YeiH family protein n=1 Tax=Caulobacter segnis TaxID=88688 RepID=UPI00240FFAC1|nr:putative sulfate exporter family transporter [Caulobacter segnis]MDG2522915.1 putative sulfate exporter family transporter [Caulobacter segnis]